MKMAVVGAGGIGGYLGARLALAGESVVFVARNRNLEAINARGFRLLLEDGSEQHAGAVRAVQHAADAGPQDAVLLAVKAHQVAELLPTLRGLMGPETMLVSLINGVPWWYFQRLGGPHEGRRLASVDPGGLISDAIDPAQVIGSVVYPAAELVEPGVVKVIEGNRFSLGELDGTRSERIEALAASFMKAGFKAPVSRDIRAELWVKLWGNLSFNPVSALTQMTLAQICRHPGTRALVEAMMTEAQAVAEALGVRFRISIAQRIAGAEAVGEHKTSMLQDVQAGRAPELAALVGAVLELAAITGVPAPHIAAVHAAAQGLAATLESQRARLAPVPLAG
jgi:2-dehydropantoate 2-reductase